MSKAPIVTGLVAAIVAGAALALPYYGVQLPQPMVLAAGAAISIGAVFAILTATVFGKHTEKVGGRGMLGKHLSDIPDLIEMFPTGDKVHTLSIRPETVASSVDTVLHPEKYAGKKIVMSLRPSGPNDQFNPSKLRGIFDGLRDAPDFAHILLFDSDREFLAYIPGPVARTLFVGPEAETNIARLIGDNYDPKKSVYIQLIGGANRVETICNVEKVSAAVDRMAGGFRQLVVLDGRSLKRPIGLIRADRLIDVLTRNGVPADGPHGDIRHH